MEELLKKPIWNVPYCPAYNPIEMVFAQVKHSFKKQKIVSKDIHIGQNGYSFIYVSNLIDDFKYANTTKSISWYLSMQQSGAQSYWLSFAKDGRICGDHGL